LRQVGLWFSRLLLGEAKELEEWAEWRTAFEALGIPSDQ
jgi:hypothetical protein